LSWLAIIATPCCKGSSVEAIYGLMRRCLERQMNPRDIVVSLIDVELINIQALLILTKRARKANCAQYRSVERFAPFKVTHAKVNMIYQSPLKVSHCYAVGKAVTDKQSGSTDSWPAVQLKFDDKVSCKSAAWLRRAPSSDGRSLKQIIRVCLPCNLSRRSNMTAFLSGIIRLARSPATLLARPRPPPSPPARRGPGADPAPGSRKTHGGSLRRLDHPVHSSERPPASS
jgi:hypothetical protein